MRSPPSTPAVAPKITFLMLVTERDLALAHYSIRSYRTLARTRLPFTLQVYANCLTLGQKRRYFPLWRDDPWVQIVDNTDHVRSRRLNAGDVIVSPEGARVIREGPYEHCDEIWSRHLATLETPYHATVDADFEILKPGFVLAMLDQLDADPALIAMSSDYTPTLRNVCDSYTQTYMDLHERWHTWFCIYKKEARTGERSHFYYSSRESGRLYSYDSSAYFQKGLIEKGYQLRAIDPAWQNHFIHYGAFSKNRSIGRRALALYRRLAITRKVGLLNVDGETAPVARVNRAARRVAGWLLLRLFAKAEKERGSLGWT